jgi:predicted DsbA family dithiol-disulfide isomerase
VLDKFPQEVKLVFKNFPLSMHKYARKAAKAALAAHGQGKFWDFHRALFENHRFINDAMLKHIARQVGLDMERFAADVTSPALEDLIARDVEDGREIGISGIPAILINGKILKGSDFQAFEEMIVSELNKRQKTGLP